MKLKLEERIRAGMQVSAENKRLILQLTSLMDLQTTVPDKALLGVVAEEVEALRAPLATEVGEAAAGDIIARICGEGGEPDGPWRDGYGAAGRAAIDRTAAAHASLEHRVAWLTRPPTLQEIQRLDPVKDCEQIYHFVTYDFRLENKLYANLFEARPTVIPTGSLMFHSTGEFTLRSVQRIAVTQLYFANLMEWGIESRRGREALERLNGIHGRYSISSDTFKFILANIMFVPGLWNQKLGWRPHTEIEELGWYHAFAKVGRAMNIRAIPDDREEMRQWWMDYCARMADSTPVQRKTFDEIVLQILAVYPKTLRRFALNALLTGMDDLYRNALGYPAPPPEIVLELKEVFRVIGHYTSLLPRIPWARSLQTWPMGGDISRLGVNERSPYMTTLDGKAPNRGYPERQRPLAPEEGAERLFDQLPVVTEAELSRHTEVNSAWLAIQGIVYDVTPFLYEHPGGANMLKPWLGKDATKAFERVGHSPEARALMLNFRIGRLPGAENQPIPVTQPATKRRPTWDAQQPVSREEWDKLLDAVLGAAEAYVAGLDKQAVQQGGPVAHFPVHLPSHGRPQGTVG